MADMKPCPNYLLFKYFLKKAKKSFSEFSVYELTKFIVLKYGNDFFTGLSLFSVR